MAIMDRPTLPLLTSHSVRNLRTPTETSGCFQTDTFLDRQNAGIRPCGISNLLRRLQEGFVTTLI